MSQKTKRRLSRFADELEAIATSIINALELIIIDTVFGKSKYRKHAPRPRQVVQKTVIHRASAPRVVYLRERQ